MSRLRFALLSIASLLPCGLVAQPAAERPYVVLVSLDAFRYDCAERYHAANLLAIAKDVAALADSPVIDCTIPNRQA